MKTKSGLLDFPGVSPGYCCAAFPLPSPSSSRQTRKMWFSDSPYPKCSVHTSGTTKERLLSRTGTALGTTCLLPLCPNSVQIVWAEKPASEEDRGGSSREREGERESEGPPQRRPRHQTGTYVRRSVGKWENPQGEVSFLCLRSPCGVFIGSKAMK